MTTTNQEFNYHALNRGAAVRPSMSKFTDAVTEYFAYVALVGIAVAVAIVAMAFSANIAVRWLDNAVKPGFFEAQTQSAAAPSAKDFQGQSTKAATFAMLPAPMPLSMKDDVISTNY